MAGDDLAQSAFRANDEQGSRTGRRRASTGSSTASSLSWALDSEKALGMGRFLPGRWGRALASSIALVLALLAALPSWAADEDDFYRGKTITIIIPIGPGGAY